MRTRPGARFCRSVTRGRVRFEGAACERVEVLTGLQEPRRYPAGGKHRQWSQHQPHSGHLPALATWRRPPRCPTLVAFGANTGDADRLILDDGDAAA